MSSTVPPTSDSTPAALQNLRPLSIGEILDRAFSISFKNIIAFAAIVLIVVGPQMLLYYLGARDMLDIATQQLASIGQASTTGAPPIMDPQKMFNAEAAGTPYFGLMFLISMLFVPLSNAAVVSGVSRAYLGLPVRFGDCYGDAIPRWVSLLILTVLWFVAAMLAFGAIMVFFILLALAFTGLTTLLHTAGAIFAAVIGVVVGIAALLLMAQTYLAVAYSFTGTVLEGLGPVDAFASGFRRVFGEDQFWRSLGIAASLFGIFVGFGIVASVIGGLALGLTHSFALDFAFSALVNAFTYPFVFAVVAVSYYDVRIRREGFDLQLLAARLSGAAPQ